MTTTARGLPTIVKLTTARPDVEIEQRAFFDSFYRSLYADVPGAEELFASTGVRQRRFSWDPKRAFTGDSPPTRERMDLWERVALELGRKTVPAALENVDRERVGSFVMASCTGYAGPTPELRLAEELGLRPDLRRTFVGHMGCCAAFNALRIALDALAARPEELVLVNCTELCSLHIRPEVSREQLVIHALFGDASATVLMGVADATVADAGVRPQLLRTHTQTHYGTADAMTWRVLDDGFRMTLSPYVPFVLAEAIVPFVERLLGPEGLRLEDIRYWCIHPGGPKIIEFVADRLGLDEEQIRASKQVLAECGNCSSATVLLVLERILALHHPAPGEHGVMMAFGPGLTMESILLRF